MSVRARVLAAGCVICLGGFSALGSGVQGATIFRLAFEPGIAALNAPARARVVEAARAYGQGDTVRIELGTDALRESTRAERQALSGLRERRVSRELQHLGVPQMDIGVGWLGPDDPLLPMGHGLRDGRLPRIRVMMPHP